MWENLRQPTSRNPSTGFYLLTAQMSMDQATRMQQSSQTHNIHNNTYTARSYLQIIH